MRYDNEHKTRTRARVLDAAAQAIRHAGPEQVGVSSVMANAGLTHGGFYAHFASKGELVLATLEHMFAQGRSRVQRATEGKPPAQGLRDFIDDYLSPEHRDARDTGCPIAALSSDLPRLDEAARTRFAAGVRGLTQHLAELLAQVTPQEAATALDTARSTVAELVGALALARTEPDPVRSAALLNASQQALKQRLNLTGADT